MFTGIVEETGTVDSLEAHTTGARLRISCSAVLADAFEGSSIAVNGVCLTAVGLQPNHFSAELAPETLTRSNLGALTPGSLVNLERPLLATGRLSGHVVQGHVDGKGEFVSCEALGDENYWLRIRIPSALDRYIVEKGSIAIDGISLTVASISDLVLAVSIIPHTWRNTALRQRNLGDEVNLECDIFAKYLEKMVAEQMIPGLRSANRINRPNVRLDVRR